MPNASVRAAELSDVMPRMAEMRAVGDISVDGWLDVFSAPAAFPAGSYVCQQGSEAEVVYLLQEGFAKIVCTDDDGGELIIALKAAPTILGVTAAVMGGAHSTSIVIASTARTRYCSATSFRAALQRDPARLADVLRLQCRETEMLVSRVSAMGLRDAETRLLQLLQSLGSSVNTSHTPGLRLLPLKHSEMASFVGVTPEHFSRIVGRLAKRGVICQQRGRISIPDTTRLSARVPAELTHSQRMSGEGLGIHNERSR